MHNIPRLARRAALPLLTAAVLAALPAGVSAQAVGAYLHQGVISSTSSSGQAQSISNQPATLRPGMLYPRPTSPIRTDLQPTPIVRNYSHGPVVTVPDAASSEMRPGIRFRDRQPNYPITHDPEYNPTSIIAPVGPANGFFTKPVGPAWPGYPYFRQDYSHPANNPIPVITEAPPLLGGYHYGGFCNRSASVNTYPSIYCAYDGFPRYIFSPTVIVAGQSYCPDYSTSSLPFNPPSYTVTDQQSIVDTNYNENSNIYPIGSYRAAFMDIASAWTESDIEPLRRHIRDNDTHLSVFLNKKYSYSISSGDFVQITRDALDRLDTVSFTFTRLRKENNGDVTAFGKHIYRVSSDVVSSDDTVPFDQQNSSVTTNSMQGDQSTEGAGCNHKTVYVSYTLRHRDDLWYIISIDTSDRPLVISSE